MQSLFRALVAGLAALLALSLLSFAQSTAASAEEYGATRQDGVTLLEEGDEDDDEDETDEESLSFQSNTGTSNDATGSRETAVSRDRDVSRDDLTRDFTLDGGELTRDRSANHTNDRTRNDTRG